jgi:hypothetical protein
MNCCPKYKMESKRQVIRLVPPQVGAPAGEGRDSYSRMTRITGLMPRAGLCRVLPVSGSGAATETWVCSA